jgi:archaellum biogenesis ATPase FlaH
VKTGKGGLTVVSTGCQSLDSVLMDGVPLGSILAVQEDWPKSSVNFASLLCKSFISEAIQQQERCLVISKDASFLDSLPERVDDSTTSSSTSNMTEEQFKIAWRYKHLQHGMEIQPSKPSKTFYDFGKKMSEHLVNKYVVFSDSVPNDINGYQRIVIVGCGSPLFDIDPKTVLPLIRQTRERSAVMMITTPTYCIDPTNATILNHLCDCVINLDSVRSKLANCDCFLTIVKPFTVIRQYLPEIMSMCIKLDKRRLVVEPFHLPPDLDEAGANPGNAVGGCASGNKVMDF